MACVGAREHGGLGAQVAHAADTSYFDKFDEKPLSGAAGAAAAGPVRALLGRAVVLCVV